MSTLPSLCQVARDMLNRRWRQVAARRAARPDRIDSSTQTDSLPPPSDSLVWIIEDLVELVAGDHDRPVAELEPLIRRRLTEQHFSAHGGDSVTLTDAEQQVDTEVAVAIDVLEHLRRLALRRGQWSTAPATPIMFG